MTGDEREGNGVQESEKLVVSGRIRILSRHDRWAEGWAECVATTDELLVAEREVAMTFIADTSPDACCVSGTIHDWNASLKNENYINQKKDLKQLT